MHDDHNIHPDFGHRNPDMGAECCEDQLAIRSTVGRGLQGDSYRVEISSDSTDNTILEGIYHDEATKQDIHDWFSENINGGELHSYLTFRPDTTPPTFVLTLVYSRPGRPEWSRVLPAIPYIWDTNGDGIPDVSNVVGSGVANLYIKTTDAQTWIEKLIFPPGTNAQTFNAPAPLEPWTVNLNFGIGGDIEVINLADIAKILGITIQQITNIVSGVPGQIDGSDNMKDYIDNRDEALEIHFHADQGFGSSALAGDNGTGVAHPFPPANPTEPLNTIKKYIDWYTNALRDDYINRIGGISGGLGDTITKINNTLTDIVNKIYGGGTIGPDGHITWGDAGKVPTGNMNLYGNSTGSSYIRTHTGNAANDIMGVRP